MKQIITLLTLILSTTTFGQIDRTKAPKPQPNPQINIPRPQISDLDNGLTVIVVENHNLPKISYQLYIDNPPMLENEKVGVADIFGELIGEGTKEISKEEFTETIDFIGARFYPSSRGFYASSLTKHSEKLLTLLSSMVKAPLLDENEFNRLKTQMMSGLEGTKSDAGSMSANTIASVNYGKNHPYGEVLTGQTLDQVKIDDMKAYYKDYFNPNHAYLVIVGDVTEDKAKADAQKYFGEWQAASLPAKATKFETKIPKANQVYFVKKPGAVQSVIKVTNPINFKPDSKDAIKLSVLNSVLGGGSFSARLMSNLREDKAYTYGCYSSIDSDKLVGEFSAGGNFRNEVTDSAITQILFEIERVTKELISPKELDLVIKSKTGAFARSLEDPRTVARFALNTIRYKLPANYYSNYLKTLETVTSKDLLEVAQTYLKPNQLNIVVVGNEEIAEKLVKFDGDGRIEFKNEYGETALNLEKVAEGTTTESVIEKYIHAVFMTDNDKTISKKLKINKFIQLTYDGTMAQPGVSLELTMANASPNKSAVLVKANGMTMQQVYFNGSAGKSVSMQGSKDLTDKEIKEKSEANFPFNQFYYLKNSNLEIKLLGVDVLKGEKFNKLEVKNKLTESLSYEWYNVKDGLLHIVETITTNEKGESMTVKMELNDYKSYGTSKTAMKFSENQIMNNNGMIINMKLKSVEISKKYNSGIFEGDLK